MTKEHANPQALQWFRRSVDSWTSQRTYLFAPQMKPVNLVTNFTVASGEKGNQFIVDWKGQTSGTMELELNGLILSRSRDYLGDGANSSVITMLDDDSIVMRTSYSGLNVRESITLLHDDSIRLRQTVAIEAATGKVRLTGSYFETRL
jgi:hypothetical protein